ncbi:hypothetical protein SAMN04487783_0966 [Agrococcus baldri]|uniref:Uncharacterized protein n=2 Tax=Agrococcus baldri TaxID=153730 RepID=A0AA94HLN6_9MICO|nr:hypothetical protein SAMN04487783_0966 [Agrococcus baldri]
MPAEVDAPARPDPQPTTERPEHTAEPDASDALESPRRAGLSWRHVLIGAVVGAIVGAAIPGGLQLAERAAASADADSLRAAAIEYLTAIAEGRAGDATAMVPLPRSAGDIPDAVLQSADRIEVPEVLMLHIDGDAGTVQVSYEIGRDEVTRTLDAERADGGWRLTTSLAERVMVQTFSASVRAQIAGFPIPFTTPVHLYPGSYAFDDASDEILRTSSEPFTVDGDEATPTATYFDVQLAPAVAAHAGEVGVAVAAQCQEEPDCSIATDFEVVYGGGTWVQLANDSSIDVSVQLMAGSEMNSQWFDARMRIMRDETGALTEWLCASLDDYGVPSDPCPVVE